MSSNSHFCILLFLNLFSTLSLAGQQIDWYVHPVITDAEEIVKIYDDHKLLMVKGEGDYYGLKDFNNKLIVPVKYKSISIIESEKLIMASTKFSGGIRAYYDYKGNKKEDIQDQSISRILKKQNIHNQKVKLEKYFQKFPNLRVEQKPEKDWQYRNKIEYSVFSSIGDTIYKTIRIYDPNSTTYFNEVYGKYLYSKGRLFSFEGVLVRDFGKVISFRELENGWLYVQKKDTFYLYDDQLNLVLEDDSFFRSFLDSVFYIKGRKKLTLKRLDGAPIKNLDFYWASKIEGTECFYLKQKGKRQDQVYNGATDELIELNYTLTEKYNSRDKIDKLQVVTEKDKFGVVNLADGKLHLGIDYGYVRIYENYIVTAPADFKKERFEYNTYTIRNRDGQELKTVHAREPRCFEDLIILKAEETQNLLNADFNVLKELDFYEEYFFNEKSRTLTYLNFHDQERRNYFLKDIRMGVEKEYGHIEALDSYSRGVKLKNFFPIEGVNGKQGAVNIEGEFIVPIVLDDILSIDREFRDLIVVKKDGKLGILKHP